MPEAGPLPPLLLIHGAWQGGWVWDRLLPELARLGVAAHPVDLPGNGWGKHADAHATLDAYADHVIERIAGIGAPVVVVGHSGGGITASQVAERVPERLAAVVYLAGMMLPDGVPYVDIVDTVRRRSGEPLAGVTPHLQWNAARTASSVPAGAARDIFLHDADADTAAWAAARLRPQPESGRAIAPHISADRWGRVPRIYVEALQDRSLALSVQREMQVRLPGALRTSVDCGHVPQLVQPRETARVLCAALRTLLPTA